MEAFRCDPSVDNRFGPAVNSCRSAFDFTLLFEQSILSIGPSVLFLLSAVFRRVQLSRRQPVVAKSFLYYSKIAAAVALVGVHIANLVLWSATNPTTITRASIASASLGLVDALALLFLLHSEHFRSLRPSTVALIWLFSSLLFEATQTRTLFLVRGDSKVAISTTVSVALKCLLVVLESTRKTNSLKNPTPRPSEEETSSTFARDFFWWLIGLFRRGYNSLLKVDDLDNVDTELSSRNVHDTFIELWRQNRRSGKTRPMLRTIAQSSWEYLLIPILPRLLLIALRFSQPFLVQDVVNFAGNKNASANVGYGLIGAFALVYTGLAILNGRYKHYTYRWVVQVRGNLVSVIYAKSMTLKYAGAGDKAAVSLMSTDIERIVIGLPNFHEIWASVIEVAIATWLLARQVSYAVVAPVGLVLLTTVLAGRIGPPAGKKAGIWAGMVQKRVAATNDYLGSLRAFRISGLGAVAAKGLQALRVTEVAAAMKFRNVLTIGLVLAYTTQVMSPFLTFASYSGISLNGHGVLDSARLFTALSIIALLTTPLTYLLQVYPGMMAAVACIERIEEFCLSEDAQDERIFRSDSGSAMRISSQATTEVESEYRVEPKSEKVESLPNDYGDAIVVENASFGWESEPVVKNANFTIRFSQLTIVNGPSGSGKSTILKALMGEVPLSQGSITIDTKDIAFCDQTAWLPNSTIQQCILGYGLFDSSLYSSVVWACALDEDFAQMEDGDKTQIGSKGANRVSGGQMQRIALARALYARRRIYLLDDVFSGLDNRTQHILFRRLFSADGFLTRIHAATVLVSSLTRHNALANQVITLKEDGLLEVETADETKNAQDGEVLAKASNFGSESDETDLDKKAYNFHSPAPLESASKESERSRGIGDRSVYKYYATSIGTFGCIIYVLLGITNTFLTKFPEIWMKWWAASNDTDPNNDLGKWLGVFAMFVVTALVVLAIWSWFFFNHVVAISGINMHEILVETIRRAPMSFFSKTDSGETINRFSQDLSMIDGELPIALFNFVAEIYLVLTAMIFISVSSGYAALCIPFVALVLYLVQRFYLRTSKQMRIMDLESKAPLYAHFTESASGLATLRAFGWTSASRSRNEELLAYSQKPFYLLFAIQRWLALVLDLVVAGVAVVTMGIAVGLHSSTSPGWLGVALVNIITLSEELNNLVVSWTKTEASIGSIARIKAISEEISQSRSVQGAPQPPPENWPSAAAIEFQGVSCAGGEAEQTILEDINVSIAAGQKIGICGRTGSGKSTLVGLLFRLMDPSKGKVIMDGVDVSTLDEELLRSKLSGVAQDSCILPGTIRENLTVENEVDDEKLVSTLERFGLWKAIESAGGLDAELGDDTLSHGQKQLFCFIRAYLRPSKLLVLDEATSSMTEEVETVVVESIQEQWKDRTVIAVAHRLRSIVGFDKVMVLKDGRILEFDSPEKLLAMDSEFKKMYDLEKQGHLQSDE